MVNSEKDLPGSVPARHCVTVSAWILTMVLALQLMGGTPARADVIYNYASPALTEGWFTCNIVGSVTFSSVPLNSMVSGSAAIGLISSWWFDAITSSGTLALSSSSGNFIESGGFTSFSFDSSGNITSWDLLVSLTSNGEAPNISISANQQGESPPEYDIVWIGTYWSGYSGGVQPDEWTAVPAPASILLLGSSLLGLAVARLRKR